HGDIDLVLARTRLRAIANAAEPLPLVGARRNENDLRACFCQNACRLRKFDVITYEDRNPAVIGVIDVETMSGAHLIRALLRCVRCTFFCRKILPLGVNKWAALESSLAESRDECPQ